MFIFLAGFGVGAFAHYCIVMWLEFKGKEDPADDFRTEFRKISDKINEDQL
jgi:hypothetical protein